MKRCFYASPFLSLELKFTPLEFETAANVSECNMRIELKFTPLEFETSIKKKKDELLALKFTPLEFETHPAFFAKYLMSG